MYLQNREFNKVLNFQFPVLKIFVVPLFHRQKGIIPLFRQKNFCYKRPPLYNGHFFTGSPWYIHSCFNLSIYNGQRFRNCVPLFHPKRDQLEKYFLNSYGFIPI